ncbi:MAG: hypothetical protein V4692_03195 [Bdellovibrionota bacterium]
MRNLFKMPVIYGLPFALLVSMLCGPQVFAKSECNAYLESADAGNFALPPEVQSVLTDLRADNQQDRVEALEALIEKVKTLPAYSTAELLKKTDLDESTIQLIRQSSSGFYSVDEFLKMDDVTNGFALGLASLQGQYEMLVERKALISWNRVYSHFEVNWETTPNHTDWFMNEITNMNRPIVYMLPAQTLTYQGDSITNEELRWLLARPEKMGNVRFILGAYDIVSEELNELRHRSGISKNMFRSLIMRGIGAERSSWDYE